MQDHVYLIGTSPDTVLMPDFMLDPPNCPYQIQYSIIPDPSDPNAILTLTAQDLFQFYTTDVAMEGNYTITSTAYTP